MITTKTKNNKKRERKSSNRGTTELSIRKLLKKTMTNNYKRRTRCRYPGENMAVEEWSSLTLDTLRYTRDVLRITPELLSDTGLIDMDMLAGLSVHEVLAELYYFDKEDHVVYMMINLETDMAVKQYMPDL